MNTLVRFKKLNPELELVENKALHKELHKVSPSWNIFINRSRGLVEVHDTAILDGNILMDTHVMTEPVVSWKIVHDAKKYNTRVHDPEAWFKEQDKITDARDAKKRLKRNLVIRKSVRDALYG